MSPIQIEELLANRSWMQPLARSLIGDGHTAEDVVQEAWIAAHQAPPSVDVTRPWLARVIRNLSSRVLRTGARRQRREQSTAREEAVRTTPEDVVNRAELHAQVTDAVMKLDEPYRTTVLLRFFEGLPPRDIARREDVPVNTVRTRTRRALEQLRESLDARYEGGRTAWCSAVLPLALAPDLGTSVASGALQAAAPASTAGASITAGSTKILGGLIVTKKTIMAASVIGLAGALAGVGTDRFLSKQTEKPPTPAVAVAEYEALEEQLEKAETALARRETARKTAVAEVAALKKQLGALEQERTRAAEAAAAEEARVAARGDLPVTFGEHTDLDVWKNTDWSHYATAALGFNDVIRNAMDEDGNVPLNDREFQLALTKENIKLAKLALSLDGVPSHVPGNGPYTHPLVMANLMSAVLESEELALSDAQLRQLEDAGARYETRYGDLQRQYDDGTPPFQKVLDELLLKSEFVSAARNLLDDDQLERLFIPETEGTNLDLFAPVLMAHAAVKPFSVDSSESGRTKYAERVGKALGFNEADAQITESAVNAAWARMSEALVEGRDFSDMTTDAVVAAGLAHAELIDSLRDNPSLSENSREAIADAGLWPVPFVKQPQN